MYKYGPSVSISVRIAEFGGQGSGGQCGGSSYTLLMGTEEAVVCHVVNHVEVFSIVQEEDLRSALSKVNLLPNILNYFLFVFPYENEPGEMGKIP